MVINKEQVLKRVKNKEDKIIVSNTLDKYLKYEKTSISTYTNFLDVRILEIVKSILDYLKIDYNVYTVNEYCEKSIIYFGDYEDFITIYKVIVSDVKHSDILGCLFSIGLSNDTIGDILLEETYAYITNLTRLNSLIETSLYEIKQKRVKLEKVNEMIITRDRFIYFNIIVPSYRLDVIIGKLAHFSRSMASKYILDGNILVNYEEVSSTTKMLKIGDIISIRKVGKFIINKNLLMSKKDNYVIEIKKYN